MSASAAEANHKKAPICAKFVEEMREAFGEENVIVLYVKENDFELDQREKE